MANVRSAESVFVQLVSSQQYHLRYSMRDWLFGAVYPMLGSAASGVYNEHHCWQISIAAGCADRTWRVYFPHLCPRWTKT